MAINLQLGFLVLLVNIAAAVLNSFCLIYNERKVIPAFGLVSAVACAVFVILIMMGVI